MGLIQRRRGAGMELRKMGPFCTDCKQLPGDHYEIGVLLRVALWDKQLR